MGRIGLICVTAALCAALATAAGAQVPDLRDPGPALTKSTGLGDTVYTPVAKEPPEGLFKLISGPRYVPGESPSPERMAPGSGADFGADLLDVALVAGEDTENAIAVGAACKDTNGDGVPEDTCADSDRVPVIYTYTIAGGWQRTHLDDDPGYIASVAYFADGSAIAVGGTGRYPRREAGEDRGHCEGGRQPSTDPLDGGTARVWRLKNGAWRELSDLHGADDGSAADEIPDTPAPDGSKGPTPGLTAVDAYIPDPAHPIEFAIVGGLCQLWHWTEGEFWHKSSTEWQEPFSPFGTAATKFSIPGLLYRVRQVRFAEPVEGFDPVHRRPRAYAAMSGCCSDERLAAPSLLTYATIDDMRRDPEWCASNGIDYGACVQPWRHADDGATAGSWSGGAAPLTAINPSDPVRRVVRVKDPDSYLGVTASLRETPSVAATAGQAINGPGVLATPTGPESQTVPDPPSSLMAPLSPASLPAGCLLIPCYSAVAPRFALTSARLVDGSGDRGGGDSRLATFVAETRLDVPAASQGLGMEGTNDAPEKKVGGEVATGPDGVPDWSVGVMRASGQAIAYSTNPTDLPPPDPALAPLPPRYGCVADWPANKAWLDDLNTALNAQADMYICIITNRTGEHSAAIQEEYDPTKATDPERAVRAASSHKLLALPTYALNAIDFVESEGKGLAVGDHGAVVALDAGRSTTSGGALEPKPPTLGGRRPIDLPARTDWAARLPASSGQPGQMPPASDVDHTWLDHPELSPEGSPGRSAKADEIIMRADGGEGWALGYGEAPADPPLQLTHFDGARWTRCAGEGSVKLDPSCESTIELREQGIKLLGADRVPLEADSDPANDSELEIVAVATGHILRYRDGRWALEDPAALEPIGGQKGGLDVAFVAPDDGLILSGKWDDEKIPDSLNTNGMGVRQVFYRYDGERWQPCNREVAPGPVLVSDCDPHDRLPRGNNGRYSSTASTSFCDIDHANNGCITGLFSAGERIYARGIRRVTAPCAFVTCFARANTETPLLTFRERDGSWNAEPAEGEIDPGAPGANLSSLAGDDFKFAGQPAVAQRPDGLYEGWALVRTSSDTLGLPTLLRQAPGRGWEPFTDAGAHRFVSASGARTTIAIRPSSGGGSPALMAEDVRGESGRLYELDTVRMRWRLVRTPFMPPNSAPSIAQGNAPGVGWMAGIADDRQGGFWAPTSGGLFYRYTDRPRAPLLAEAPQPSLDGARISAIDGAPDGTLWAATPSNQLYRYDRALGWDRIRIPGWDRDRGAVTKPGEALDIAVAPNGSGLVVGEDGRIARIAASGTVELDPAAGVACDRAVPVPPCGTPHDLLSVAIAADGSALAAGRNGALLWRPAGGELRAVEGPPVPAGEHLGSLAMPEPDIAWLVSSSGKLWHGELAGGSWSWQRQTLPEGSGSPLRIALGAGERGYLIAGDSSATRLFERTAAGAWQRIELPVDERDAGLASIALAERGQGAAIGGANGLVLTLWGERFEVARHPDPGPSRGGALPQLSTPVSDLALLPGFDEGEAEAWALSPAASGDRGTDRLLHYGSPRADALLGAGERAAALADSPAPREGELSVAAFGKSDCQMGFDFPCKPQVGMLEYSEVVNGRIIDEISERSRRSGGPSVTLFTGDAVDSGGHAASEPAEQATGPGTTGLANFGCQAAGILSAGAAGCPSQFGPWRLRRWGENVADRLADRGVPVLGAIGARDVSDVELCSQTLCTPVRRAATTPGENLAWRRSMALRSAPWGSAPVPEDQRVKLRKLRGRGLDVRYDDQEISSPAEGVPDRTAGIGGTDTNYAVDVFDPSGERKTARLVFVDNSTGSLAVSDPLQQPLRPDGQAVWLDSVLCFAGEVSAGGRCTRQRDQRAIVVANTPTYSYGVGAGTHTAADGAAFEAILMKNRVDLVVSGKIGWNGRYWATAPGVHEPCPGSAYPTAPPSAAAAVCGRGLPVSTDVSAGPLAAALVEQASQVQGSDALAQARGLTRTLPFVVASGAGGRFFGGLTADQGNVRDGFWHGYTIARLDPSGDPSKLVVEQRPVYDWVGIEAQARALGPGQKMTLRGYGRGPVGYYIASAREGQMFGRAQVRFDAISTADVTHRYSLLAADSERPWLPLRDSNGSYEELDPAIATIDPITGVVKVGKGNNPKTLAVGMLSVGCVAETEGGTCDPEQIGVHVATYPLAFEPRRTFKPVVVATPRVTQRAASAGATLPPPPSAPPAGTAVQPLNLPPPPQPPALPPIDVPQVNPPSPPVPPPPPLQQSPVPLDLSASAPGVTIAPQTTVIPPPAPPIQPAPPGGARREARQRQSATQSSGSGAGDKATDGVGDLADGRDSLPGTNDMTRIDRVKPGHSFTPVARADQPSAWARGALYGGGISLMALALAFGWSNGRPDPRRRDRITPAPEWATRRRS